MSAFLDDCEKQAKIDDAKMGIYSEGGYFQGLGESFLPALEKTIDRITGEGNGGYERQLSLAISKTPGPLRQAVTDAMARALPRCESPIEKRILPWLIAQRYPGFEHAPLVLFPGDGSQLKPGRIALIPQLPIGKHRVDFALAAHLNGIIKFIVVECDGAEFHKDVHKDVERDAALMKSERVLDIIPLTGKEIYSDAQQAAQEVARGVANAFSGGLS